jgi:hypothetical protein
MNNRLVGALLALRSRGPRYRPEKHYMRGPGPKTLSKLGEMYRAETESELRERLPDHWLAVIRTLKDREHNR